MSQTNIIDVQRITQEVWAIINALPHREAIKEGDARHWVDDVVGRYGELAKWHAIRAGGFGGSQIGALVRNFFGQRADHGASARKIVGGALLREVPDEPTGPMQRGIAMEPAHRDWFMRKYGAHRDVKGFEKLSKSVGPRPWMRYSPDELAFMPNPVVSGDDTLNRWLGDYKAPGEVEESESVAFQYVSQLHMGRLVCIHNGLEVHGMILSQLNWREWSLKDDIIHHMPELDQMIIQAGDHYWNDYVLRSEVPSFIKKARLEDASELVKSISQDSFRLARLKAMAKVLKDQIDPLQASIVEKAAVYRFGGASLTVADSMKISAVGQFDEEKVRAAFPAEVLAKIPVKKPSSSTYDVDALVARARATLGEGEKMNQFYAPGKMDSNALYQAAADLGLDADDLLTEQIRMAVSPSVDVDVRAFLEREFPELVCPAEPSPLVEEIKALPVVAMNDELGGAQENREGQHESRHVPRLVHA